MESPCCIILNSQWSGWPQSDTGPGDMPSCRTRSLHVSPSDANHIYMVAEQNRDRTRYYIMTILVCVLCVNSKHCSRTTLVTSDSYSLTQYQVTYWYVFCVSIASTVA